MKIHQKQKRHINKIIILIISALLLALGGYITYAKLNNNWPFAADSRDVTTDSGNGDVNYSPPTEQEVKDSQDGKRRGEAEKPSTDSDNTPTDGEKTVVPVAISSATIIDGKLDIRAFTPRIIEGTGECIATISNGGKKITAKSSAFVDTSSSICQPILVETSQLSSGEWQIVVSYISPDAKGTSQSVKVTI